MGKISLKLQLFLLLFLFSVFLSWREYGLSFFVKSMIAVAASVTSDSLYCFLKTRKFKITESSLITGQIIGFVLSSAAEWRFFVLSALCAVSSKHFIRFKGKHIFNPAAMGIFSVVVLFNQPTLWHGAYSWYLIVPCGLYIVWQLRKVSIVSAYFLMYVFLSGIQSYYAGTSFIDKVQYANYFFIFVMLIEPKTSPHYSGEKIAFGLIVSTGAFLLYFLKLPYDVDIPALLIGNLLFRLHTDLRVGQYSKREEIWLRK